MVGRPSLPCARCSAKMARTPRAVPRARAPSSIKEKSRIMHPQPRTTADKASALLATVQSQHAMTREQRLELLNLAVQLGEELKAQVDALCPDASEAPTDLTTLATDEKLALGQSVADQLAAAAFSIAPQFVLDRLEHELPAHAESRAEAAELLRRLSSGTA